MNKTIFEIDGNDSSTLPEFAADFTKRLNIEIEWHGNLDALNDILHGGFGTPEDGFILIWKNSEVSRKRLGYPETIKWINERINHGHPYNVAFFKERLALANEQRGATLFDTIVEIFTQEDHADIELRLE